MINVGEQTGRIDSSMEMLFDEFISPSVFVPLLLLMSSSAYFLYSKRYNK